MYGTGFVYGNGLSSVIFNGTEYWYVYNAQGDVIGIIDKNGDYVVEYTYDAWGKPLSKTGTLADTLGTLNPFRYRGYIYDEETGFYYVSSRYYDPEIGRWLNADGYVSTGQGVLGHNMFAYCNNNPIMLYDLSGCIPQTLSWGSVNDDVFTLQNKLNENGATLIVDGIFGPKTDAAVRTYQQSHGLAVDGIVGRNTWTSLLESKRVNGVMTFTEHILTQTFYGFNYSITASVPVVMYDGKWIGAGGNGNITLSNYDSFIQLVTHKIIVESIDVTFINNCVTMTVVYRVRAYYGISFGGIDFNVPDLFTTGKMIHTFY